MGQRSMGRRSPPFSVRGDPSPSWQFFVLFIMLWCLFMMMLCYCIHDYVIRDNVIHEFTGRQEEAVAAAISSHLVGSLLWPFSFFSATWPYSRKSSVSPDRPGP